MRIQSSDRLLWGIVGGAVLLAIIAAVVVFTRTESEYRTGNDPADVVFNYILALERGDYERAYSYLSPTLPGYPKNVQQLRDQLPPSLFSDNDVSYMVVDSKVNGDYANVLVRETIVYRSDLISISQSNNPITMELVRTDTGWQLTGGSGGLRIWEECWEEKEGC
ncbi:hypothetical protein [Chloroflexus sp.]|uniref:hypothetical protein n=1 Tax=Chloroflexus sp. TaxID=1904827 RepID=UPI002ACEB2BB|nr:hypothetical protein [Chloroflexus sp.]